jgi:hypothetical protein
MQVEYYFVIVVLRIFGAAVGSMWPLCRMTPHCVKNVQLVKTFARSKLCFILLHVSLLKYAILSFLCHVLKNSFLIFGVE